MKIGKDVSNERGQVAIIVALLIISLLGMTALVIDVGSIYEERRQTQTVADAAALAGAQNLPEFPEQAIQTAITYADLNGVVISEDNIQIYETYVPYDTITVTPTDVNAPLFFARVLDVNSVTVNATATAMANSPLSMKGLMPWTVPLEDYPGGLVPGIISYDMKVGPHDLETPGWFQIMRFDGPGANIYGETIVEGCESEIWINELYDVQPGNIAGKTGMSIDERLGDDDCTFWDVVAINDDGEYYVKDENCPNCPRIVYIPLIEERPKNPSEPVEIIEFSIFFLEDVEPQGHNVFTVTGRFVDKMIAVSYGGTTGYSGGIKVIRLVK